VDVFNPESAGKSEGDIHINPASQEIYADFFNAMLGTDMTWQEIFAQTDRDINLQRVMNVMRYGRDTSGYDWIPDRAIGPTDDTLYLAEAVYNDGEVSRILGCTAEEAAAMETGCKREALMDFRKSELRKLIEVYYAERGWNTNGVPFIDTLKELGLWEYMTIQAQGSIMALQE
jgi:aldehyde:ferredoxin oxidoreductase